MRASKVWIIWRFLLSLKEVSLERLRAAWRYLLLGMGKRREIGLWSGKAKRGIWNAEECMDTLTYGLGG